MSDSVQISFNRKEYWDLLEILAMSDWVLFAHDIDKDKRKIRFQKIISKIHSFAKIIGYDDMIKYYDDENDYFPTKKFEETSEAQIFIQEYEDETFWDELVNRLVQREIDRMKKAKTIPDKLGIDEYFEISTPIEEIFSSEFENNGLENLILKEINK